MADQKPKFDKIVSGRARVKQDSIWKQVADAFFVTDGKTIKQYLIQDVFVPLIKRTISGTVDMILYGDSNHSNRYNNTGSYWNVIPTKVTPYTGYFNSSQSTKSSIQAPQKKPTHNTFDNLAYDNRADAEKVLRQMQMSIETYGLVSAGDMYDMADVQTTNYTLNSYGWTDLSTARVINSNGFFMIDLPAPSPIK